jgi:hypothetical protein
LGNGELFHYFTILQFYLDSENFQFQPGLTGFYLLITPFHYSSICPFFYLRLAVGGQLSAFILKKLDRKRNTIILKK